METGYFNAPHSDANLAEKDPMQVKTVWRLSILTTMLGAVSLMAQTGILALEQPER